MAVDLRAIEALALDQASLKAAAGLARPAKWSEVAGSADGQLIWGACAGSGANPYRVAADLRDLGTKCTCPSRKFPCKHGLALLWLQAEAIVPFPFAETPDWVGDWLARRRPAAARPAAAPDAEKAIGAALAAETTAPDPAAVARNAAAAERRAVDTARAILEALDALESWVGDQLRLGLAAFIDDATARCRRIAARLVDGKAAVLAGRIDELPGRLLALPSGERPHGAAIELARLVLLARAYRATPGDPAIRRAVAAAESREEVLADAAAIRLRCDWEVLAEQVETRRDGLVAQTTWLLNLGDTGPRFAMLLDFFPASAGRRGSVFTPGEQFTGEVAFYPAATPLRAFLVDRIPRGDATALAWPPASGLDALASPYLAEPWALDAPLLLPPGRIAVDGGGEPWWRARGLDIALPLGPTPDGLLRATDLDCAAALWSGTRLALLAAQSPWGRLNV